MQNIGQNIGRQMGTEAFSVRSDSKKVRQLDRLAKIQDRSRNYLVNQAIDQLLELYAWQTERIREGLKAADAGQFASEAELERIIDKYKNN
jgi:predicted transcriptional regulator